MKNRIFTILLSVLLTLPMIAWAEDTVAINETTESEAVEILEDGAIEQNDNEVVSDSEAQVEQQYKQPLSKRKIAKKFLAAMGGVGLSSFAIFFLLTFYNRIRENYVKPIKTLDGETSLETPNGLNNAIKTFLEKTDWK